MKSKETRISMDSFQSLLDVITCSRYTNSRNTAVGFHVAKIGNLANKMLILNKT